MIYFLFFCSGVSGLIYQVVWVRAFGNAFGNTIHSASLIVALFMLGLGAGSYLLGGWADRRYAARPDSLLRVYAYVEGVIAALGLGVSLLLPHLGALVAAVSSYTTGADGWHVLTASSYLARVVVGAVLLLPITMLMGGTLTLLIRHLVRADLDASGWTIAWLYGLNTAGAAAGAFLTDFVLAPAAGLFATQVIAVALNVVAGGGAWWLSRRDATPTRPDTATTRRTAHFRTWGPSTLPPVHPRTLVFMSAALALSGFAVMGMEILWLRHATLLLGGFRAVFSLLLTVMLIGLGIGALLGGWLHRRTGRPAQALMVVQALFVVAALFGIGSADAARLAADAAPMAAALTALAPWRRALVELWYNAMPMLLEVGLPSVLAGFAFPLANGLVQRTEQSVGRRAGLLCLANTAGAVCGSLATGYLLLPMLGIQPAVTVLAAAAALAVLPLHLVSQGISRDAARGAGRPAHGPAEAGPYSAVVFATTSLIALAALGVWLWLPGDYVLRRALAPGESRGRVVATSEGATELIEVVEMPGRGRGLITNGHAMSSSAPLDQRYMRALAHIPLLVMSRPERVLVIGFGVGNTTHAATLHPSVQQVDVADLSRHVLEHAGYFADANHGVLQHAKVSVYVNDGRQHLQMSGPGSYDLITLEPPPIAHAGVGALYAREFYALARSRLTAGGYVSQWLPAYQVPSESSLAMVRAFVDVFPQAVLLSGAQAELLLLGTTAPRIEIDPARIVAALASTPRVREDLARLDLGTAREIIGTFVGSAATLTRATRASPAATDDKPVQEYGVRSILTTAMLGVPAAIFNLDDLAAWCPRCFSTGQLTPAVAGLDAYMALLEEAYTTSVSEVPAPVPGRRVMGSAYLGAVVPDSEEMRGVLADARLALYERGETLLEAGRFADAAAQFREALATMPDSAAVHNNLGVALASAGDLAGAASHFREAVGLDPRFPEARRNLAVASQAR